MKIKSATEYTDKLHKIATENTESTDKIMAKTAETPPDLMLVSPAQAGIQKPSWSIEQARAGMAEKP